MRAILFPLLMLLAGLVPGLAFADDAVRTINPMDGQNIWDMYVFGNGRVIYDVLMGVKMLMVPDVGSSGFLMLLLLLATAGFVVLAVMAGFDPGKNLMKMVGYIFVVWAITFGTTKLTANIRVTDLVPNASGMVEDFDVSGVPALVSLPAALISQVGRYFSQTTETYFSIPDDFKLAGGSAGVGQFNLFAKMVHGSTQYGIVYPELKRSLSAYVSDCVVPAIARGVLSGPGVDSAGKATTFQGTQALLHTTNLMDTFASAQHKSIMTTYFPVAVDGQYNSTWTQVLQDGERLGLGDANSAAGSMAATTAIGFGAVVSCESAYAAIKGDMEAHAQALLAGGAREWSRTGVNTPFANSFKSMLAHVGASGDASSFILQQSMINSMSGAFRTAAVQTNNNELMQAAALSQAEQSQKSAWSSGFTVFNNMMGYVFTVLQAFIFAITPFIVIALMVPGLGKSIFVNYVQILIWLTLWMPLLAVINYIITLFAMESISGAIGGAGGVSMANQGLMTERALDLIIAAQFLGTMVPLLAWGLVKGAMAFTEFISHGIGSSFATQAGGVAATGNMSMNNMSMDNTSMNKFDTAFSSKVGTQAVQAFTNAGAMLVSQDAGGSGAMVAGASVDNKKAIQDGLSKMQAEMQQAQSALSEAMTKGMSLQAAYEKVKGDGTSFMRAAIAQDILSKATAAGHSLQATDNSNLSVEATKNKAAGKQDGAAVRTGGNIEVGAKAMGTGFAAQASLDRTNNNTKVEEEALRQSAAAAKAAAQGYSDNTSAGRNQVGGINEAQGVHSNNDRRGSDSKSVSEQQVLQDVMSSVSAQMSQISRMQSLTSTFGVANDTDLREVQSMLDEMQRFDGSVPTMEQLGARFSAMESSFGARAQGTEAGIDAMRSQVGTAAVPAGPSPRLNRAGIEADAAGTENDFRARALAAVEATRAQAAKQQVTAADAVAAATTEPEFRPSDNQQKAFNDAVGLLKHVPGPIGLGTSMFGAFNK